MNPDPTPHPDLAATATERAFANAFSGAEDSLVGFFATGKLEFQGLADSILVELRT